MDLLSVVVKPTWKEFLIDLVQSKQMDPWDIDIIAVAEAYMQRVRELRALDLRLPANVILACALLLRFKADTISFEPEEPEEYYEEPALIKEDLPELAYKPSRPRKRAITLSELIKAVEQVMKQGERPVIKFAAPKDLAIDLPKADMNELMAAVYEKAMALKDNEGLVLFSQLIRASEAPAQQTATASETPAASNGNGEGHFSTKTRRADAYRLLNSASSKAESVVYHLIPVLHLLQEDKVIAWQDELFGEIFIKVMRPADAPQTPVLPAPAAA